jgi:GlcNAc-P-P-Und epimerase
MLINIIGGSGFIGTRYADLLLRSNREFLILDKVCSQSYPKQTLIADVRNLDALEQNILEGCPLVNLAAEHQDNVRPISLYEDVNVLGAKNLCAVARAKNIQTIVFTSSVAVYGFADPGTDESGAIAPFNEYGKTKYAAERIFSEWQQEAPLERVLVIIRPTVVFGEGNRGNVYNLLNQIAKKRFVMVGSGLNRKSMAYVENIAAFIDRATMFPPGTHVFNYVDSPDYSMNELVASVKNFLGHKQKPMVRIPKFLGLVVGKIFDLISRFTKKQFPISEIRIKKFCANSTYSSSIPEDIFIAPVRLEEALKKTVIHEFGANRINY